MKYFTCALIVVVSLSTVACSKIANEKSPFATETYTEAPLCNSVESTKLLTKIFMENYEKKTSVVKQSAKKLVSISINSPFPSGYDSVTKLRKCTATLVVHVDSHSLALVNKAIMTDHPFGDANVDGSYLSGVPLRTMLSWLAENGINAVDNDREYNIEYTNQVSEDGKDFQVATKTGPSAKLVMMVASTMAIFQTIPTKTENIEALPSSVNLQPAPIVQLGDVNTEPTKKLTSSMIIQPVSISSCTEESVCIVTDKHNEVHLNATVVSEARLKQVVDAATRKQKICVYAVSKDPENSHIYYAEAASVIGDPNVTTQCGVDKS